MFGSIKLVSGLVLSLRLLEPVFASPQAVTNLYPISTISPDLPSTCPRSTITTTTTTNHRPVTKTIDEPACPTVTSALFIAPVPCPPQPSTATLFCHCPLQPATSTITHGCAGKCCPSATATVRKAPTLGCPRGCEGVCHPAATTTVTNGC